LSDARTLVEHVESWNLEPAICVERLVEDSILGSVRGIVGVHVISGHWIVVEHDSELVTGLDPFSRWVFYASRLHVLVDVVACARSFSNLDCPVGAIAVIEDVVVLTNVLFGIGSGNDPL